MRISKVIFIFELFCMSFQNFQWRYIPICNIETLRSLEFNGINQLHDLFRHKAGFFVNQQLYELQYYIS